MWTVFKFVAALFIAVESADVTCPHLPCPFVGFCKETVPTYYDHDGVKCRGCDQCVFDAQDFRSMSTRQMGMHYMCPMVLCVNPGTCNGPYTYSYTTYMGMTCTGCPSCPTVNQGGGSILQKKEAVNLGGFNLCPMVLCMAPGPCDVALQTSVMHFNGRDCAGCAYCPTTTTLQQ